jgi:hypothetical protein
MSAAVFDISTGKKVRKPRRKPATADASMARQEEAELERRVGQRKLTGAISKLRMAADGLERVGARLPYDRIEQITTYANLFSTWVEDWQERY